MHDESAPSNRPRSAALQRRSLRLLPQKLAGAYLIAAILSIALTHFGLSEIIHNATALPHLQSGGDFLFASLTAWMLYGLARRSVRTQQQTEAMLRESEERLQLILQNMPVMLDAFDEQGNIVIWNQECERVTGYSATEMIGKPQAMALLYPEASHRQHMIKEWATLGNDYRDWEWDLDCKDGSKRTISWSTIADRVPIPGWKTWGIGVDVTDRKQAEQQNRTLNQQLEQQNLALEALVEQRTAALLTLINALPDYIFVIDRQMRFQFCSEQNARFIGFEARQQVEGKTIFELFLPEQAEAFAAQNQQVIEAGEILHFQAAYDRPEGTLHLDTYKIPLKHPNGTVYALIGAARDITALVAARQELADRTAQLESINQELESFSYSVSHDLRAPLRHINGFVAALTKQLEQNGQLTDPQVRHYLQIVQNSSQTMGQLIDGLLTLSRVGRRQMAQAPVDLNRVVATVLSQLPQQLPNQLPQPLPQPLPKDNASAQILTSTGDEPAQFTVSALPTVIGDATLLQQVFANLIDNALKFSHARKTSAKQNCSPAPVEIGSLADGTIFVRDQGVGFQMEYADQLFGAFQRLHSRSEFEGHGIGLAIVQRIIHGHDGQIWAESQPGHGATFYFKLGDRRVVQSG